MNMSLVLTLILLTAACLLALGCSGGDSDARVQGSGGSGGGAGDGTPTDAARPAASSRTPPADHDGPVAEAVFAGGCFWCVEAVFEQLDGVIDALPGYAGGDPANANYQAVASGRTKHAEVVKIIYDPTRISYTKLLEVHFATHDPTQLNRQGPDVGPQYRSAIFFANEEERRAAEAYIRELEASGAHNRPIVTTLEPLDAFHIAEDYHHDYVARNPQSGYVQAVSMPKVEKVRRKFSDRLKDSDSADAPR